MTTLFKLPPGAGYRLAAIPVSLLFGLLGCAMAALLTWQASPIVASEPYATALARTVTGAEPSDPPATWASIVQCVHANQDRICEPILPAAADPAASYVEVGYRLPHSDATALVETIYQRLPQEGWTVGRLARGGTPDALPEWQDHTVFWAFKGDDVIRVSADASGKREAASEPTLTLDVYRQAPSLVTIAAAIGLVLGSVIGWLAVAAVLRLVAQKARSARFAVAAAGVPAVVLTTAFDVGALVYAGYLAAAFGWSPQDSLFGVTAVATVATMVPIAGVLTIAGLLLATAITFLSRRPSS